MNTWYLDTVSGNDKEPRVKFKWSTPTVVFDQKPVGKILTRPRVFRPNVVHRSRPVMYEKWALNVFACKTLTIVSKVKKGQ